MIKLNHFKLGLFFVVCTALGLGVLIWIGASHLFRHTKTYAAFFNESVGGLNQGASVNYLGLKVGEVSSVKLAPDGKLIMVIMEIQPDFKVKPDMAVEIELAGITGQRNLLIGKAPPDIRKVTPEVTFPVKYPVIPSHPGEMQTIEAGLNKLYQKIESMDLEGVTAAWKETAQQINRIVREKDLPKTLHNAREASADLNSMIAELRRSGTVDAIHRGAKDFAATAAEARKSGEYLKKQIQALPPGAFAHFTENMDRMAAAGESAVASWKTQMDQSMALFQQTLFKTNQLIRDSQQLIYSLKEQPGRIMMLPGKKEPFRR
jgi:ABC-type transporter Mla subunit MlaD